MSACAQCGFDYETLGPRELPGVIVSIGVRVGSLLTGIGSDATLRRRPRPEVWSALEYACHVRDVLVIQRDRLHLALVEDTPSVARMYGNERVVLARYNLQDPETVAEQLNVVAQLAGQAFADLDAVH
jgi:S-DNA-T family DNA segregation ATPase FtsK/SpoIIIE